MVKKGDLQIKLSAPVSKNFLCGAFSRGHARLRKKSTAQDQCRQRQNGHALPQANCQ